MCGQGIGNGYGTRHGKGHGDYYGKNDGSLICYTFAEENKILSGYLQPNSIRFILDK